MIDRCSRFLVICICEPAGDYFAEPLMLCDSIRSCWCSEHHRPPRLATRPHGRAWFPGSLRNERAAALAPDRGHATGPQSYFASSSVSLEDSQSETSDSHHDDIHVHHNRPSFPTAARPKTPTNASSPASAVKCWTTSAPARRYGLRSLALSVRDRRELRPGRAPRASLFADSTCCGAQARRFRIPGMGPTRAIGRAPSSRRQTLLPLALTRCGSNHGCAQPLIARRGLVAREISLLVPWRKFPSIPAGAPMTSSLR